MLIWTGLCLLAQTRYTYAANNGLFISQINVMLLVYLYVQKSNYELCAILLPTGSKY